MRTPDRDAERAAAAEAAVAEIRDGMLVGLGSGATAAFGVRAIGRRESTPTHLGEMREPDGSVFVLAVKVPWGLFPIDL